MTKFTTSDKKFAGHYALTGLYGQISSLPSLKRLLLIFVVFFTVSASAQNKINVTGKVTDEKGAVLPGVSVKIKNTTTGTTTNAAGIFTIQANQGDVLVFNFIGLKQQEMAVKGSTMDVTMADDTKALEQVVVIGYGSVLRRDLTGAVTSVKGDELTKNLPQSVNQGLQGMVAGVQVNRNDGAPGAGISLTIRGANSFTGSEPLYVIDDIPVVSAPTPKGAEDNFQTVNGLAFLNPQDVESIEILKDASATAIYGSRGANGVVLITTKKGKAGRDKVTFIANAGVATVSKKVEILNAYEYALLQNEAYANFSKYFDAPLSVPFPGKVGIDPITLESGYLPSPEDYINGLPAGTAYPEGYKGTNWQDEIFRQAITQDYTLQISGGNDKGNYSISGNYMDQQGIIRNSGFKRYGTQINIHRNVSKLFQVGINSNMTFTDYQMGKTNTSGAQPSLISSTLFFPSTYPKDDPFSARREELINSSNLANPFKTINESKDLTNTTRLYTSGYAQLNFLPWLNFRQRVGYNYNTNNRQTYYSRNLNEGRVPKGIGSEAANDYAQLTLESLLNFRKTFAKDHNVDGVVAFTYEKAKNTGYEMRASNFPTDLTENYNLAAGLTPAPLYNFREDNALMSVLGRVNYNYKRKYLFTVNFRRDGSSKFAEGHKYSNFGSVAFAWTASEEEFVKNLNLFSTLKLRTSAGTTGNQGIGPYATLYHMVIANAPIDGSGNIGSGYRVDDGRGIVDPDLKWETTRQIDLGVDMGFLKDRLTVTVDLYYKRTQDLLQSITVAPSTGFRTKFTNFGTVENRGLELTILGAIIQQKDLKWNVNANLSFNRNKILDLPADQFSQRLYHGVDQVLIQRNGYAIGTIYGLEEDGFYDNLAEVRADPRWSGLSDAQLKQKLGEIKYKDGDGDRSVLSQATDRKIIGDTNPDYSFGITNTVTYKRFDFSVFVHGAVGGDIINTNLLKVRLSQLGNSPKFAYDGRWTPETAATATWPRADASSNREYLFSDRFVEDGTFIRLKTISLGYTFKSPAKFMGDLNVYGTLNNVLTISKYSWFDPDVNSFGADASRRGVDMNSYPNTRTFTLGIKASL